MSNWTEYELSDVVNLKSGTTVKKELERDSGDVAYIKVSGMNLEGNEVKITTANTFLNHADININHVLPVGSTIFPKRGGAIATNKKRITGIPLCIDLNTMGVIPKPELVLPLYIYYYFQIFDLLSISSGTTIPQINNYSFNGLKIFVPPIPEQKRIVAILDQAFADIDKARANAEQNLKNARELFESYLQQVFSQRGEGWVEEKMSDVCEGKITDGTHQTPKYFENGYVFLSSRNVTSGVIDWVNIKYIDEAQHVEMQKRLSPRRGDILLAKNGTTGVAAIVDRDEIFDIYVSLALLRPSEKIIPRYLLHFVNSRVAKKQFNKRLKGIGVPNLHLKEIRDVVVVYPEDKDAQKNIVRKIDELLARRNQLESIYSQKLVAIDELKKSILQKAFSGELTKNDNKGAAA